MDRTRADVKFLPRFIGIFEGDLAADLQLWHWREADAIAAVGGVEDLAVMSAFVSLFPKNQERALSHPRNAHDRTARFTPLFVPFPASSLRYQNLKLAGDSIECVGDIA